MFFRHGAAHEVCLTEGVPCKILEDLHDLFLINDDAVGLLENGLQKRREIADLIGLRTVFEVRRDEIHGSRAIERDPCNEVFETVRLKLFHEPLHAALFELEHGVRIRFRNELIGALVVALLSEGDLPARVLFDVVERFFDIGEGRECEEVHLEHADGLHLFHVELRGDIFAVSGKRNVVRNFFTADDDARRMHGSIARHPLQFEPHIDDALELVVRFIDLNEFGIAFSFLIGKFF